MSQSFYQKESKIPVPLAVLVVMGILIVPALFLQMKRGNEEEKKIIVENIAVSNISPNTTTISWKTKEKLPGSLYYGETGKGISSTSGDDRDLSSFKLSRYIHYVTLKNLNPSTSYSVKLKHGDSLFSLNTANNLQFKTTSSQPLSAGKPPFYGKLVDASGIPVKDTVVFVKIKKAALLSTYTKEDGSFLVSLCCLVNEETYDAYTVSDTDVATISIRTESNQSSKVITLLKDAHPLPQTIVLGQDKNLVVEASSQPGEQPVVLAAASEAGTSEVVKFDTIDIFYPKPDALIPGGRPLFKGRTVPKGAVTLNILPQGERIQLIGGADGIWNYTPARDLSQGSHTLAMETVDESGKKIKKERTFTILKNGEAVLGDATPEATITPFIVESPTPFDLTTTPSPIITEDLSLTPTAPVSGVSYVTFSLLSLGLIIFGVGMIVVF